MNILRPEFKNWTPNDYSKLNAWIRNVHAKIFGNISMSDMEKAATDKIHSFYIQPQGEGNIDPSFPLYIRFYIPDVRQIKQANINIITSRYRIDSKDTKSGGSSTTTSQNSSASIFTGYEAGLSGDTGPIMGTLVTSDASGTETVQKHSHPVTPHTHDVNIPAHTHDQNMSIYEASTVPTGVKIYVNDNDLGLTLTGDDQTQNNVDIAAYLISNSWNVVKCTCTDISRVTIYSIIELLEIYY